MNSIKASMDKSDYPIYDDYLNIKIDDQYLDEILDKMYPEKEYKGLIPTLLTMVDEEENRIVNERILPKNGSMTLCPILMCPDDCDFSCTIIIVEVENKNDEIILWKKIGLNNTNIYIWNEKLHKYEYELIGQNVEWFYEINTLEFSIIEYKKMIELFQNNG
jgi:hypothetical protein